MRWRCRGTNEANARLYTSRGIAVCERWDDFRNFLADMGPRPSPAHSIERVDNGRGYEPGNCVWALPARQMRNKRTNHLITYEGKTQPLADWAAELGMPCSTLQMRLTRGWPTDLALTAPRHTRGRPKNVAALPSE